MKLRRVLVRTVPGTGTKLYRHDLTIPAPALKALGWDHKTDLGVEVCEGELRIRRTG